MNKLTVILICVFTIFVAACGQSNSSQDKDRKENVTGDAPLKLPPKGSNLGGL